MAVATPVLAYIGSLNAGTEIGSGSSLTVTLNITQGWEVLLPVRAAFGANVSLDPSVRIFPSSDGGANYDSLPITSFSISRAANGNNRASVRLMVGQYAVEVRNSGPTATFQVLTAMVVTAVINV